MEFLLSLTMEGFARRTGIVLYRRRNRSFDPGRIRMVDNHKQGIRRVENYLHAIGIENLWRFLCPFLKEYRK